jgi:hypothetical protein
VLTRCERRRTCKGRHTEKADEALRSTQEGGGVDACIGDGDICERLIRGSDCRISMVGRGETDGDGVKIGRHLGMRVTTCRPSWSLPSPIVPNLVYVINYIGSYHITLDRSPTLTRATMPHHPLSSSFPTSIRTKSQFWEHVISQLVPLLDGQRHWVNHHHVAPPLSFPLTHLFLRALRAIHSGDQSGQHIFSRLSFFALISHFWRWSFLRKLVW